jgi:hypothetical protein
MKNFGKYSKPIITHYWKQIETATLHLRQMHPVNLLIARETGLTTLAGDQIPVIRL